MLAVWITLTPGRCNEIIDYPKAKGHIVVQSITDVMPRRNMTLELLEQSY